MSEARPAIVSEGPQGLVQSIRQASAIFLNRAMLAVRAGITFRGKRDLYEALGYQRIIRPIDYRSRYQRGGVAGRVVDALPTATWRGGCEVLENEDPDVETEFEQAFEEFAERLHLWSMIKRADVLSGLGQFSILLVGAPGDLREPIPERLSPEDVFYVQPYSQEDVLVQLIDTDPTSERFGLPTLYQVRRLAGSAYFGYAVGSKLIHHSRVIHIADNKLDDRIFGHPLLERCWNYLDDLDKVSGGGAEAFWKRADQGIIFDMDPALEMAEGEAKEVKEAADEFIHGYRRIMATRGLTAKQMGSDVADFSKAADGVITLIAGATGIPKRILVGSERGELASTQDRENWEQRITDRRSDYAEPEILRPLVEKFIGLGVLPEPEDVIIRWPDIEYLNEQEQAAIAVQWANVNQLAGAVVVLPQEIRDRVLRLEKLEEHQLPDPDSPFAPPQLRQPLPNAPPDDTQLYSEENERDNPNILNPPEDTDQTAVPPPATSLAPLDLSARAAAARGAAKKAMLGKLRGAAKYRARKALKAGRAAVDPRAVRVAMTRGRHEVAAAVEPAVSAMAAGVKRLASAAAEAHHRSGMLARAKRPTRRAAAAAIRHAVAPAQDSLQYAAAKAADAVSALSDSARANVGAVIDKAFDQGWGADRLAAALADALPLSTPQYQAVDNLISRLQDADPGDIVAFGRSSATVPSGGATDEWIDRQASRYSDDLLDQRAQTVADNALAEAAAQGQRDEWSQMAADGTIDPETTFRRFVANPDACDDCKEMDGEVAGIDEPYENGEDGPPVHVNCSECDEELFQEGA